MFLMYLVYGLGGGGHPTWGGGRVVCRGRRATIELMKTEFIKHLCRYAKYR